MNINLFDIMSISDHHKTVSLSQIFQDLPEDEQKHLLDIFNQLQKKNGYISKTDLEELASLTGKPESELHGLISFFDAYRTRPPGRNHLSVCNGTACYALGANLIYDRLAENLELDDHGTTPDGFITVDKVRCVGACNLAPVIIANDKLEGNILSSHIPEKLKELKKTDEQPQRD